MSNNDQVVLDNLFSQRRELMIGLSDESECFEVLTFEQILKEYDLSYDELLSGRIGDGGDGGIDGFFTFVGEDIIDEDTSLEGYKRGCKIDLHIIQSKRSASFSETAVERVTTTILDLFNLAKDESALRLNYNPGLVSKALLFRNVFLGLQNRHPELHILFTYATRGDTNEVHVNVLNRATIFKDTVIGQFRLADVNCQFIGARELLDLARIEKTYSLQLKFLENYISRGEDNYVILASLKDFFEFITDERCNLRKYIFEANVRDYAGDVEVNQDIKQTLLDNDDLDFWCLNNGITIIASRASIAGKTITIDDVQVVNGLQTTTTIYDFMRSTGGSISPVGNKAVLLRIIVTTNQEARDRIIKATNFQTRVPAASLRATDKIQRDIEDYFLHFGWYYDRRKNFYKNEGKPAERIISISYLAQSIMAIVLQQPDNSRARPSSLIKSQDAYSTVFSPNMPLEVYLFCARIMRQIDSFVKSLPASDPFDRVNFKFHLATLIIIKLLRKRNYQVKQIQTIISVQISYEMLKKYVEELTEIIYLYIIGKDMGLDTVAKSRDFVQYLINTLQVEEEVQKSEKVKV